jgi:hypothetical protein
MPKRTSPLENTGTAVEENDAWIPEARDWLVACRVANERLSPEQIKALTASMQKLSPAALRVLVTVYEQSYGVQSPLSAADRRPPDSTEAEREWIIAYRILYERLSVTDAKQYAQTLLAMNPNQIRALVDVYQEKKRQQDAREAQQPSSRSGPSISQRPVDNQAAARQSFADAQARMEFEQMRRGMALGRASNARAQTNSALVAANATTAVTAAAMNERIQNQENIANMQAMEHGAFQDRMYERSTAPNPYQNNNYYYRLY